MTDIVFRTWPSYHLDGDHEIINFNTLIYFLTFAMTKIWILPGKTNTLVNNDDITFTCYRPSESGWPGESTWPQLQAGQVSGRSPMLTGSEISSFIYCRRPGGGVSSKSRRRGAEKTQSLNPLYLCSYDNEISLPVNMEDYQVCYPCQVSLALSTWQ